VLARELSVGRVLLDDRAARTKARLMGLTVTGTIGILILAKKAGVEIDLRRALDVLIQQNFRISLDLYDMLVATQPRSVLGCRLSVKQ
jgi:predicted nucleic acid-binding protein